MRVERAINFDDLRRLARRRLPKIAFDFIEGGIEGEHGLARNEDAFRRHTLVPRYLNDVSKRDLTTTLFGRRYANPFGIAPTGAPRLFREGGDHFLAQAARDANIPFISSGAATETMEKLATVAPDQLWYQLYTARQRRIPDDMIRRAADSGISTLVLTVDVPVNGKRERNLRNGFSRPLRPGIKTMLETLLHPAWLMEYARRGGQPGLANWLPYVEGPPSDLATLELFAKLVPEPQLTWADVERWRRLWPRNFVIKGLMHEEDAMRAANIGVDGIIVSNHGARQLDYAPSPLEVLPAISAAAGDKLTVMFDSGIRRGSDALVALCLGAKFVFVGRGTLYGLAAGGVPGVNHAIGMLRNEIDLAMTQMGATSIAGLGPQWLSCTSKASEPSRTNAAKLAAE